jgi:hypothetical protein
MGGSAPLTRPAVSGRWQRRNKLAFCGHLARQIDSRNRLAATTGPAKGDAPVGGPQNLNSQFDRVLGARVEQIDETLIRSAIIYDHAQPPRLEDESGFRALGVFTELYLPLSVVAGNTPSVFGHARAAPATARADFHFKDFRPVDMALAGVGRPDRAVAAFSYKSQVSRRDTLRPPPVDGAALDTEGRPQRRATEEAPIAAVQFEVVDAWRGVHVASTAKTSLGNSGVGLSLTTHRSVTLDPAGSAPHQQIVEWSPSALEPQSAHRT